MKIALIGYGNMGQEIERLVQQDKTHSIISISYRKKSDPLDIAGIQKADVAIDFTAPDIVISNIQKIALVGTNLVVGTTGWHDKIEKVKAIVAKSKNGLIYAGNFSIGANVFFQIVAEAARRFNDYSDLYDVSGFEVHHTGKKDSPSGTARKLADTIIHNFKTKKVLQNQTVDRTIRKEELHFTSLRAGSNPGRHAVIFDSLADDVQLIHQAHSREGFARGALVAAEFIKEKKGLYRFEDLFNKKT